MGTIKFDIKHNLKVKNSIFSSKKTATGKINVKNNRSAIYLILRAFLKENRIKQGCKMFDKAGSLAPPHELVLIKGEAFKEPFLTRIVTPFLEFEGYSHIVYETKINSTHPKELELDELPLSLGIKLDSLKIEQTFFRPRFSRIFGKSAEPVGSLSIISDSESSSIEASWCATEGAEEKVIDLIHKYLF